MKRTIIVFITVLLSIVGYSQDIFWAKADYNRISESEKLERGSRVLRYEVFHLDLEGLKTSLNTAVLRNSGIKSDLIISFPNADGQLQKFRIYEAPIIHEDLSKKHPNIKSYVGEGLDDKTATIRFSTTIFGFHGMILSGKTGATYIDPYTKDLSNYIVYFKKNAISDKNFECLTESVGAELPQGKQFAPPSSHKEMVNGFLRKYRLALACTVEYAAFHVNAAGLNTGTLEQKKAAVLAAMNVTMTRVNGIYERDLSVTMELVANNEDIIFINSDNFDNNDVGQLIDQSQMVIDAYIGDPNYDIGHTVGTQGGGLAQLYSPCWSNYKARGATGLTSPVGDPFDVDYVSHEMGHQFGANHTFNNSCNWNVNDNTSVEPGSGSTIMGYAGICPPNIQNNSDAYFHTVSLSEMTNFVLSWGNCSENTNTGNSKPTITPISNYTIPKGTAFVLKGNGSDIDGDELTYCWEQTNQQSSTQPPLPTNTVGPNFRSLFPSESPNRYMPALSHVLQGNLFPTWEVIPTVGRVMNFALTVRDNNVNGGQYAVANTIVTTSSNIGPFVVTSQNTNVNWESGSQQTVTWDVAGTTNSPVNTSMVNILLSDNGGASFDYVLAANTPNDGSEEIIVPNIGTANARIMIEAVGNIFYAVNAATFSIGDCNIFTNSTSASIPDGAGVNIPGTPLVSTLNITDNITIENIKAVVNINHTYIQDLVIILEHPNGTQVVLWNRNCDGEDAINVTFEQGAPDIVCANPTAGIFSPFGDLSVLDGLPAEGEWKLIVTDYYNSDSGTLVSWGLDLGCFATSSTDNFNKLSTKIYPNPNNGNFTVEFGSNISEKVNISVFDIKGRKIFEQTYSSAEKSSQNINLNHVLSGVYFVKINNGATSEVQKIIIR